ncbi:hypothetical protein [Anaeromicropila populeti]|uniref:Uncharacterized protein n=1 Tax=Anaeromicropila populeti TaxID=37658 RepID=A0A1I6L2R6_9FIRM|nr:hypothetical protein [Anaeromicropila populeti]SFR97722.1 hypothetical protein SAMN05661086_03026 [Anaeromicropila populeti]
MSSYVKKSEQYSDASSSGIMFLVVGIIGIGVIILNALGVVSWIAGYFNYALYTALSVAALLVGIFTLRRAASLKREIPEETSLQDNIIQWLKDNITADFLNKYEDEMLADEIVYFNKIEAMKNAVFMQYPDADSDFLDQIIEDFYQEFLEQ